MKDAPRSRPSASRASSHRAAPQKRENALLRALRTAGRAIVELLVLLGRAVVAAGRGLARLFRRSKPLFFALMVALVALCGAGWDLASHAGRAYAGVSVGGLDVSGLDKDEIVELLEQTYGEQLEGGRAVVYASEEVVGQEAEDNSAIAEQMTAEEELAGLTSWTIKAKELGAELPAEELAEQALSVGRGKGGIQERIDAARNGCDIEVYATYDDEALEEFAATIDLTIGVEVVDYGFSISEGVATVTAGSDGTQVDREALQEGLDEVFLFSDGGSGYFVAYAIAASVRIDEEAAQAVCDRINAALADGVRLVCNDGILDLAAAEVGEWLVGEVEETEDGYELTVHIDEESAKPAIVSFAREYYEGEALSVGFSVEDDGVYVTLEDSASIPLAAETIADLEEALFGEEADADDGVPVVTVSFGETDSTLTFDEALELGVIEAFSSYTTTYSTGSGTENRNSNIQLAAEYMTNSVVEPGESWSFNDTCGERTEERGFLAAGAIVQGEYSDDVGGGICQVATTVFNAVYDAGLPITTRYNHSLYISSYPAGRDAAVSWPDLDLVWENDTDSAILVTLTCGEGSITVTLYGVDPGYEVSTETGQWEEGEEYDTIYEVDDTLASGTMYTETSGTNGRKITIVRTVTDSEGTVLHEDTFSSSYGAIDEVIVVGPDTTIEDDEEED